MQNWPFLCSIFFNMAGHAARQAEGEHCREEGEQLTHVHGPIFFNLARRAARQEEGEQSREEVKQLFCTHSENISEARRQGPLRHFQGGHTLMQLHYSNSTLLLNQMLSRLGLSGLGCPGLRRDTTVRTTRYAIG
jgi:hypothetical protein